MNLTNYDDYDWHDEDYTGQPPDDGQLLIAGREPDTDPDDNSVTVLEYGSSTDSDSFMSDEDMDECPDEYLDDCDNLDAVILPYLTGSKPGKKKRKKKHKKKSKKKASASSKGVNLLKLAAFAKGDDEDAQLTDDEQKPPTKGRFRQPSVCQMEEELLEKTDFIYRKTVLYYYNGWYYEPIDAEGVVALYRQYISPGLDGVKNLRNHMDIYRCLKADSRLKYEDSLKDKPYCPLKNGILYLNKMKLKHHSPKRRTFTVLDACYDEDAECPVFDEFLDTITEGREELKERFMMALGYLLIEPSNGKYFFVMGDVCSK